MDVEKTITDVEWLERIFALPDTRRPRLADREAANRKHDDMHADRPDNVIPWWNGTRKVTARELRLGTACLTELIDRLPRLSAIVMVGQSAAKAEPHLKDKHAGLRLFTSAHPSPLVRAKFRDRWNAIPSEWARVRELIGI
jgi:uracil-DNA glycosylase